MSFPPGLLRAAEHLLETCRRKGRLIATAESCTGGLIVGVLTAIPGSSDVVDCGFVTYSNDAKTKMVGVPEATIRQYGAVSSDVAASGTDVGLWDREEDQSAEAMNESEVPGQTRTDLRWHEQGD